MTYRHDGDAVSVEPAIRVENGLLTNLHFLLAAKLHSDFVTGEVTHLFRRVHYFIYPHDDGAALVLNVGDRSGPKLSHGTFEDESCLSSQIVATRTAWHRYILLNLLRARALRKTHNHGLNSRSQGSSVLISFWTATTFEPTRTHS